MIPEPVQALDATTSHPPNAVHGEEAEHDHYDTDIEESQDQDQIFDHPMVPEVETKRKRGQPRKIPTKRGLYIRKPRGMQPT